MSDALDRAGEALGLGVERSLLTTRRAGAVGGVAVSLERLAARSGDADVVVVARPPRCPDLGLHVRGASLSLFDRRMETGDATFDGIFTAHAPASEEEAARGLLARSVRRVLQRLAGVGWPTLTDDAVVLRFSLPATTVDEVTARVRWCVECALAVAERAATLDAPHPLRHSGVAAAFEAAARERGMAFERNAMRAEGAAGRGLLSVRWRARAPVAVDHFAVAQAKPGWRARLRFDEPLGVGLTAHPATFGERVKAAIGARDLRVGDADFDRAWTLAARDEAGATAMLHAGARRVLTGLAALGLEVALDDEGVAFEGALPAGPEAVLRAMELLDGARDALRPAMGVGPYR